MWLMAALWFVLLVDPQWFLAARGLTVLMKLPLLLFLALGTTLAFEAMTVKSVGRRWRWYPPLLGFAGVILVMVPFTINRGLAFAGAQSVLLYWTLIVGTSVIVDTARRAEILLVLYASQYLWWAAWGTRSGRVAWSPSLANFDTYGSLMVIGAGLCGFLILATNHKWLRRLMQLTLALCVIGVVASFARGAFLTALIVAAVVWARSPHKGKTFLTAVGCAALVVIAASLLFGEQYWIEMKTIFEGTGEATGEDRWEMWKAAWGVFLEYPVFGVGFDNWGIFASTYYRPGDLGGVYGANPARLYGVSAHSSYVTIIAEQGVAGILAFGWILVDFFRRNAYLRTETAARRWAQIGGRLQLHPVALGLEAAFIAWMGNAALYSMQGLHWFYTLLAINLLLHTLVTETPAGIHRGRRPSRLTRSPPPDSIGAPVASVSGRVRRG